MIFFVGDVFFDAEIFKNFVNFIENTLDNDVLDEYNTKCVSLSETMLQVFEHKQTTGGKLI